MEYDQVAELEVRIDAVDCRRLERETSSDFTRVTTEFELTGPALDETDERTGHGEDVIYEAAYHDSLQETGLPVELEGSYTIDSFSAHLDTVDLFPDGTPEREAFRDYRRWGLESAALDLALRQSELSLAGALDRDREPVRFVASMRLGEPPSVDRVERLREVAPAAELKLDPTGAWTDDLITELAETDAVRILDLKGQYEGTDVDEPGDPELYGRLAEAFPEAVLEDPAVTPETRSVLADDDVRGRLSWDAPIHGVEDLEALPWEPRWLNVKPSRFGSVASLLETLSYCEERGIRCYGGGQFELGVGRGQIQVLASLWYPDGPNDVAPRAYNEPSVPDDLPVSPLEPPSSTVGFRW